MWIRLKESKTMWALVFSAIVGILRAFVPEFPVSDDNLMLGGMALLAFILAENFEGFRINENGLKDLLGSRKFLATIASLIVIFVKEISPDFPIDEEFVVRIVSLLVIGLGVEGSSLSGTTWIELELDENEEALG